MVGREGLESGVRTAGPFRPWGPEGGICARVDQNAPPGYRTSGSAINKPGETTCLGLRSPGFARLSYCDSSGPVKQEPPCVGCEAPDTAGSELGATRQRAKRY